ncbi:hypothetical protein U1Q18_048265 [Sarracenia purpurea var. burkii]
MERQVTVTSPFLVVETSGFCSQFQDLVTNRNSVGENEICEKLQRNHRKKEAVLSSLAGSANRGGEAAGVAGGEAR